MFCFPLVHKDDPACFRFLCSWMFVEVVYDNITEHNARIRYQNTVFQCIVAVAACSEEIIGCHSIVFACSNCILANFNVDYPSAR